MSRALILAIFLLAAVRPAAGALVYHEGIQGDLSNDRLAPTTLMLGNGDSTVIGAARSGNIDYLSIVVPGGSQLDAILLAAYVSSSTLSFIAIQAGPVFTEPPTGTDVGNLLGWTHFGPGQVGTDVLDDLAGGAGAIGFDRPLPSGTYTFWIQETGPMLSAYAFTFEVTQVPEPGSWALLLAGLGLVAAHARRRAAAARG
jgi:hypothetical protein